MTGAIIVALFEEWAEEEVKTCIDDGFPVSVAPDVDLESRFSSAFGGGWSVTPGDMPGSRSPATLVGVVAEDPPRDPGMHDPRHHTSSGEPAVHVAQGFGESGSQSCAWTPPAAWPPGRLAALAALTLWARACSSGLSLCGH